MDYLYRKMSIQSAKVIVSGKNQKIITWNWGLINAVLTAIILIAVANKEGGEVEDSTSYSILAVLSVFIPLLLLKISLGNTKMVRMFNVWSYCRILICIMQAAMSMYFIFDVTELCGDCLCSRNATCISFQNNTNIELEQTYCQDMLLEGVFFLLMYLLMIMVTIKTIKCLQQATADQLLTTVVMNDNEVPPIEVEEGNCYKPPLFEEKSQIPSQNQSPGNVPPEEQIIVNGDANADETCVAIHTSEV